MIRITADSTRQVIPATRLGVRASGGVYVDELVAVLRKVIPAIPRPITKTATRPNVRYFMVSPCDCGPSARRRLFPLQLCHSLFELFDSRFEVMKRGASGQSDRALANRKGHDQ